MNQLNQEEGGQTIDMEPDSWRQIYLTGRDLLKVITLFAVWGVLGGYLFGKFFN